MESIPLDKLSSLFEDIHDIHDMWESLGIDKALQSIQGELLNNTSKLTCSPSKVEGIFKKWLDRLADALKRLAGKVVEALSAIVGSGVGASLSFLGKVVGFVAERTWALIAFVARLAGCWLMQKVKKS